MGNRFIVISYDSDQQYGFRDVVEAENFRGAMDIVDVARPYAIPVDVISLGELKALAGLLSATAWRSS